MGEGDGGMPPPPPPPPRETDWCKLNSCLYTLCIIQNSSWELVTSCIKTRSVGLRLGHSGFRSRDASLLLCSSVHT